jgi:peptidoglycan/LPS O-acetylase OafA/YrhL
MNLFNAKSSTNTPNRLAGLDHLRAFAIIFVYLFHYRQHGSPAWVDEAGRFGWTGVDLFFILSGYLVGGQLMKQIAAGTTISFKDFYLRRAFRILPAYFVVLIIYVTVPAFTERSVLPPLWRMLTFTQNFGLDIIKTGAFSHSWSLCIEEQFYLILPLVLMVLMIAKPAKYGTAFIIVLFAAGFVFRYYSWQHFVAPLAAAGQNDVEKLAYFKWIYYVTYNRLDGLLVGATIAALSYFKPLLWSRIMQYSNILFATGLLLLVAAYFLCYDMITFGAAVFGFPLVALGYGLIVTAALSPGNFLYCYPSRVSSVIAMLSYSIYLTHKQLNHMVRVLLQPLQLGDDSGIIFAASVALALTGGILLHLAIEKPFLKLRDRIL